MHTFEPRQASDEPCRPMPLPSGFTGMVARAAGRATSQAAGGASFGTSGCKDTEQQEAGPPGLGR